MVGEAIVAGVCIGLKIGMAIIGAALCVVGAGVVAMIVGAIFPTNNDENIG